MSETPQAFEDCLTGETSEASPNRKLAPTLPKPRSMDIDKQTVQRARSAGNLPGAGVLFWIRAIAFLLGLVGAAAQPAFVTNGLVAYYPFEGNGTNAATLENDSTPQGSYNFDSSGRVGKAIRLVGDDSIYSSGGGHILVPNFGQELASGFTLSLWSKDESVGGNPFNEESYISFGTLNKNRTDISINSNSSLLRFTINGGEPGLIDYSIEVPIKLSGFSKEWKNLALTYQAGSFAAFLDGAKLGETNVTVNLFPVNEAAIGRHWWDNGGSSSTRLNAMIDEVRIYNRSLSEREVKSLYEIESRPADSRFITNGLIAFYPFNGNANDESGSGFSGTVNGATLTTNRFGLANAAYSFDGSSYINLQGPLPVGNPNTGWSVSAWANANEAVDGTILTDYDRPAYNIFAVSIFSKSSGIVGVGSRADPLSDSSGNSLVPPVSCPVKTWIQFAATFNPISSTMAFFTNGVEIGEATYYPDRSYYGSANWYIGASKVIAGLTGFYNGLIDDVRIYNRYLPPGEIAQLFTLESNPSVIHSATATPQIVNGFVVGINVTDGGYGYETPPVVLVVGGGGSGAAATATVVNGVVTSISITNPGSGYTTDPTVKISSPPFSPELSIRVKKVEVALKVVLGHKYQLEGSTDLNSWNLVGEPFVAQDEELTQELDVDVTGRFYRINEVP